MSIQDKTTLKGYFNTGDKPTEAQFADLIDSFPNLQQDTATNINALTLELGQFAWTTDTRQLRIGDGSTPGGIVVASGTAAGGGELRSPNGTKKLVVRDDGTFGVEDV